MLLVLLTASQPVRGAGRPNKDTNDVAQAGGLHTPGHVRPPLWINLSPAPNSGYTPAQIRHAYGIDQLAATRGRPDHCHRGGLRQLHHPK